MKPSNSFNSGYRVKDGANDDNRAAAPRSMLGKFKACCSAEQPTEEIPRRSSTQRRCSLLTGNWLDQAEEMMKHIADFDVSITVADPSLEDVPLIGFSSGFTALTGYSAEEIIDRNCRFLIEPVPRQKREQSDRDKARDFSEACQRSALAENLSEPGPEDCCCVQVNSRKDGTLFRNMFLMQFVRIESKAYIVAVQHEVPSGWKREDVFNCKLGRLKTWLGNALSRLTAAEVESLVGKSVIDIVGEKFGTNKNYSLCSEPSGELHLKSAFSQKATKVDGQTFRPEAQGVGHACYTARAPNQDNFSIIRVEEHFSIYGVFDGYGCKGHDVSDFVKEWLPKILVSDSDLETDTLNALSRAFATTQMQIEKAWKMKQLDADLSGTAATVIVHHHKKEMLFIAHVGNCRALLARKMRSEAEDAEETADPWDSNWEAVHLTEDHSPNSPEIKLAEVVTRHYVHKGAKHHVMSSKYQSSLNVLRSLGDMNEYCKAGVSAVPSLSCHEIDILTDYFILICSHEVWEVSSSENAVHVCAGHAPAKVMAAAEGLAQSTMDKQCMRWDIGTDEYPDGITVVMAHLVPPLQPAVRRSLVTGQATSDQKKNAPEQKKTTAR